MSEFASPFVHLLYGLAWLSFGAGHSWLATPSLATALHRLFGPYYRLAYNLFATIHAAAVVGLGWWLFDGGVAVLDAETQQSNFVFELIGAVIAALALREYDLGRFAGTRQIRDHWAGNPVHDDENLQTRGFHQYIRHPLYAGVFMILLGRIGTDFDVATAFWGCLYIIIGARFEERRLIRLFGERYETYRRQVPAYIPWKGRAWRPEDHR